MRVLDDADRNPALDHAPGLALRAPAGMRLEDGEHLLFMRDRFALQQPPVDLVDLAKRMIHKALHGIDGSHVSAPAASSSRRSRSARATSDRQSSR